MGLCVSKEGGMANVSIEKPMVNVFTIKGDYFSPDTRTMLVILQMSRIPGITYNVREIDQFQKTSGMQ